MTPAAVDVVADPCDALIVANLGLVHAVAHKVGRRLWWLEHDELVSAGSLGLIMAARRFDPSRGYTFSTFAVVRIRGAMLDEAYADLRRGLSSRPERTADVRRELTTVPDDQPSPLETMEQADERRAVDRAIAGLDDDTQNVLRLRFVDGETCRAIAARYGVTPSRISQRVTGATARIRTALAVAL